jgi:hypothetical protein
MILLGKKNTLMALVSLHKAPNMVETQEHDIQECIVCNRCVPTIATRKGETSAAELYS